MIINAPTGLFERVLPMQPSDSGTVTFTISNHVPPPRVNTRITQIPEIAEKRSVPDKQITDVDRRQALGELVYTITSGGRTDTGSSRKLFELGEIIEFSDSATTTVDPTEPTPQVVIQHNTNILDLEDIGLTTAEISSIHTDATAKFNSLQRQLITIQQQIEDSKIEIRETQKAINETNKALLVVGVIENIPVGSKNTDSEIYEKLRSSLDELGAQKKSQILNLNELKTTRQLTETDLRSVSQVIR